MTAPAPAPLADLVDPGWAAALAPVEPRIREMGQFLRSELAAGRSYLPPGDAVLRAFRSPRFEDVRVLIVGQDPYPTPGHAMGLSFSVPSRVTPLPRSLENILTELSADVGVARPAGGDLSTWTRHGVMLLNRVLTVRPGAPASHRGKGWEAVTDQAIRALVARGTPLVAILWGRDAQSLTPLLGETPIIASAHPSPLSASRGFFGSRPFSRANALLEARGAEPVDWTLPSGAGSPRPEPLDVAAPTGEDGYEGGAVEPTRRDRAATSRTTTSGTAQEWEDRRRERSDRLHDQ